MPSHHSARTMPPPPSKKARSATTSVVVEPPLGSITSGDSLFDSDSDLELASAHESGEESGNAGLSDSNSDEEDVLTAPLSPPPTVSKRKRGRKARQVEVAGT